MNYRHSPVLTQLDRCHYNRIQGFTPPWYPACHLWGQVSLVVSGLCPHILCACGQRTLHRIAFIILPIDIDACNRTSCSGGIRPHFYGSAVLRELHAGDGDGVQNVTPSRNPFFHRLGAVPLGVYRLSGQIQFLFGQWVDNRIARLVCAIDVDSGNGIFWVRGGSRHNSGSIVVCEQDGIHRYGVQLLPPAGGPANDHRGQVSLVIPGLNFHISCASRQGVFHRIPLQVLPVNVNTSDAAPFSGGIRLHFHRSIILGKLHAGDGDGPYNVAPARDPLFQHF